MAPVKAAMMKVGFVLDIARKDERFMNDLSRDAFKTLLQSGIDLSHGEVMAVVDIIHNTSISTLAPHIGDLRDNWNAIVKERRFE
ncbi:hypothetical protein [Rhodopseudomonas palustris]|uniref:Uncharacterized protein n=1 Tax=Rhodopseudomonas palustris (strain BisB18) TaxID=316056 RepID=Q218J9_RHOPB